MSRGGNKPGRPPTPQERLEWAGFWLLDRFIAPMSLARRSDFGGWLGRRLAGAVSLARRADAALADRMPELSAEERRAIIRQLFDNFTRTGAEYTRLAEFHRLAADFEIEGRHHLEAARAMAGGRMVVVSAHYGNWEAVRGAALAHQVPLGLMYRAFNNPFVERNWNARIRASGLPWFHKGRDGARRLMRHVAGLGEDGGGGALILVDQRMGGAPLLDFLGRPAETSLAPAQLANRAGAPLITAYARRAPGRFGAESFTVAFEPIIPSAEPQAMMAEVNARIGAWVRQDPGQWFWVHRRWRIRERPNLLRKRSAAAPTGSDGA